MFKSIPNGDAIFMKVRPALPFSFLTITLIPEYLIKIDNTVLLESS